MKRTLGVVLAVSLALCVLGASPAAAASGRDAYGLAASGTDSLRTGDFVPGQMLVKYRPGAGAPEVESLRMAAGASPPAQHAGAGFERLKLRPGQDMKAALERMRSSELVEYAVPDYYRHASFTPDDPLFEDQWNLSQPTSGGGINMPVAWNAVKGGSSSVVVAILDTGVAYEEHAGYHKAPDLAQTAFSSNTYDFVNKDRYADDDNGHGTHVCGTVAQSTDNDTGVAGIAFRSTIMPIKVLDQTGTGSDSEIAEGIRFAADHGADVMNMSFGGADFSPVLEDAVDYAASRGVVICCASGNESRSSVNYPAAFSSCIAVGASTRDSGRASYSNYGSALDVVAPGGDSSTLSRGITQQTYRNQGFPSSGFEYRPLTGTSMASPHVAGVAALIKARNPSWSPADVRAAITSTCRDLGPAGRDKQFGFGLVDAAKAVNAKHSVSPVVSSVTPDHARAGTAVEHVVISGSNFSSPMRVSIDRGGEKEVEATGVEVTDSTRVTCDLDLAGVQPGMWDLAAEDRVGRSGEREGAFVVDSPDSRTWFLAEGSTDHGFEEFILIQNPGDATANARITFMTPSGASRPYPVSVPTRSRVTVRVNDVLPGTDVSAKVESDRDVVCERSMYWGNRAEGTDSIGVQSPSYTWYFAEGTTAYGFDTFLLVQNPTGQDATVKVTYMTPAGPVPRDPLNVPANSRETINIANDLPSSDASIEVVSDRRVVAERSVYWDNRRGGHDSIGVTGPARDWYLAEGSTGWGFDEYVLIENPGTGDAVVGLTYLTPVGAVTQPAMTLPAGTRATVHVNGALPGEDVSVKVSADVGVIAERAMYWDNGTGKAGHDAIGVPQPRQNCFLAEGSTDWGFDEWVLVENPNPEPAEVGIQYMTPTGPRTRGWFTLAPDSRVSVHVNEDVPGTDVSTYVFSDLPLVAERSMYWNSRGGGHVSQGMMF